MKHRCKNSKNAVIALNLSDRGSSGVIMNAALKAANKINDLDIYKIMPQGENDPNSFCYANKKSKFLTLIKEIYYKLHSYKPVDGTYFNFYTRKVIKYIKKIANEHTKTIIHIHNIHHSQLNVFKLLSFISNKKFDVVITIHDAWFYTGGCYCYDHVGCKKWRNKCENCQYGNKNSIKYLNKKIQLLNSITNLHIVAVSNWVKNELIKSRLNSKTIEVIYGCTDIQLPKLDSKYFFGKAAIDKKILLSVSDYWNDWKGIKYLQKLSTLLPKDYVLVLVGGKIDLTEFNNTIHIEQVENRLALAQIYASADVYISTSQTETLGLSTCEAQICGCPVVTFGCGGSKETIIDGISGYIVNNKDVNTLFLNIKKIIELKPFKREDIVKNGQKFKQEPCSKKYAELYYKIM